MYMLKFIRPIPTAIMLAGLLTLPLPAQTLSDALASGEALGLRAGVSGQVAEVLVAVGDRVEKGQHLLSLGSRTYQARLDAARTKQAQLAFELQLVEEDYARQQELYDEGSLSTVELQLYELKVKQARSQLAQVNADTAVAAANLEYTRIVAPMNGQITAVPLVGQRVNIVSGLPVLIRMTAD